MSSCSSDDPQQFPVVLVGLGLYSVNAVSLIQSKCTSYHLDHSQEQLSQQYQLPFTCTVSLQRKKFFIRSLGVLCIKWRVTPVYGCWQKASADALIDVISALGENAAFTWFPGVIWFSVLWMSFMSIIVLFLPPRDTPGRRKQLSTSPAFRVSCYHISGSDPEHMGCIMEETYSVCFSWHFSDS